MGGRSELIPPPAARMAERYGIRLLCSLPAISHTSPSTPTAALRFSSRNTSAWRGLHTPQPTAARQLPWCCGFIAQHSAFPGRPGFRQKAPTRVHARQRKKEKFSFFLGDTDRLGQNDCRGTRDSVSARAASIQLSKIETATAAPKGSIFIRSYLILLSIVILCTNIC